MFRTIAVIIILTVDISSANPGFGSNGSIDNFDVTADYSSPGMLRGTRLLKAGLVVATVGTALVGLGLWRVYETPDENFPAAGLGLGVLGITCLSVSVPITTSGVIVKCIAKKRLRKVRRGMQQTTENDS